MLVVLLIISFATESLQNDIELCSEKHISIFKSLDVDHLVNQTVGFSKCTNMPFSFFALIISEQEKNK